MRTGGKQQTTSGSPWKKNRTATLKHHPTLYRERRRRPFSGSLTFALCNMRSPCSESAAGLTISRAVRTDWCSSKAERGLRQPGNRESGSASQVTFLAAGLLLRSLPLFGPGWTANAGQKRTMFICDIIVSHDCSHSSGAMRASGCLIRGQTCGKKKKKKKEVRQRPVLPAEPTWHSIEPSFKRITREKKRGTGVTQAWWTWRWRWMESWR